MSTIHLPDITQPFDDAVEILRVCAEKGLFEEEDLLARMIRARSLIERSGIALHLAEQFLRAVEPLQVDKGIDTLGRDLANAIRGVRREPTALVHYEGLARDAQKAAA